MVETITAGVTAVIGWAGQVVASIFGSEGALADLLPIIGVSVGIGIVGFGIRTIKNVVWGY